MTEHSSSGQSIEGPIEEQPSASTMSEPLTEHAGGEITERPGRVNGWLVGVYFGMFVWSLYYLYTYWGGLGPGLEF